MRYVLACLLLVPGFVLAQSSSTPAATVAPASVPAPPTTAERARAILDAALIDKNPDTRKQAVQAMGLVGPREPYLGRLQAMLWDKDVQVRVAAIASLMDLRDKSTAPALRKALNDDVPEVSFAAAKALWSLGDDQGREALMAVLAGDNDAASGYFTSEGRAALRLVHTPKGFLSYLLRRGIGMAHVSGLGAGVASLEGLLADQNISGRAAAALLLSGDKDPKVLPLLREALSDKDGSVRAAVVHAIALRNDPTLEPDLLPMLDDKSEAVQLRAAAACLRLELIEPPPAPLKARSRRRPASGHD